MQFDKLRSGYNKKAVLGKITIERGGEKVEVPDDFGYYSGKRINLDRSKELLKEHLEKLPDASWKEVNEYFAKVLQDFGDKGKIAFKAYFNTLKLEQKKNTRIVQESDPVFNTVALFINKELKESEGKAEYEDIIVKFFTEKEDDPIMDNIDDAMMLRFEKVYEKMKAKFG